MALPGSIYANKNCIQGFKANLGLIYTLMVTYPKDRLKNMMTKIKLGTNLSKDLFTTFKVTFTDYTYDDINDASIVTGSVTGDEELMPYIAHAVRITGDEVASVDDFASSSITWIPRKVFDTYSHAIVERLANLTIKPREYPQFDNVDSAVAFCKKALLLDNPHSIHCLFICSENVTPKDYPKTKPKTTTNVDDLNILSKCINHINALVTHNGNTYTKTNRNPMGRVVFALKHFYMFNPDDKNCQSALTTDNIFGGSQLVEDIINLDNLSFLAGSKDNFVEYGMPPKMNILRETDESDRVFDEVAKRYQSGEKLSSVDIMSCIPQYMFDYIEMEGGAGDTLDTLLAEDVQPKKFLVDKDTPAYVRTLIKKSILAALTESMVANSDIITQIRSIAKTICRTRKREEQLIIGGASSRSVNDYKKINDILIAKNITIDTIKASHSNLEQFFTSTPDRYARITEEILSKSDTDIAKFLKDNELEDEVEPLFAFVNGLSEDETDSVGLESDITQPLSDTEIKTIEELVRSDPQNQTIQGIDMLLEHIKKYPNDPQTPLAKAVLSRLQGSDFLRIVILLKKVYFNAVQVEVVSKVKRWADTLLSDVKMNKDTIVNIMRRVAVLSNEATALIKRQDEFIVRLVDDLHLQTNGRRLTPEEKHQLVINVGVINHSRFENTYLYPYYRSYEDVSAMKDGSTIQNKSKLTKPTLPPTLSKTITNTL